MGAKVRYWQEAWWVAIYQHGKRRMKCVGPDRAAAESIARAAREQMARGALRLETPATAELFEAYAAAWLKTAAQTLKPSTHRFYSEHVTRHLLPTFTGRPMQSLRRSDCRLLVQALRAKGLRVNTVRGILRTLSTILSQAVDDELLPANPALRLGKHLRAVGTDTVRAINPFTNNEQRHLLNIAEQYFPELAPWVMTALRTGMRAGELLGLQWRDINWVARYLHVQRNLVRGALTTPKNHQQRKVDLSKQLAVVLRLHKDAPYLRLVASSPLAPLSPTSAGSSATRTQRSPCASTRWQAAAKR
jgi:integrase